MKDWKVGPLFMILLGLSSIKVHTHLLEEGGIPRGLPSQCTLAPSENATPRRSGTQGASQRDETEKGWRTRVMCVGVLLVSTCTGKCQAGSARQVSTEARYGWRTDGWIGL